MRGGLAVQIASTVDVGICACDDRREGEVNRVGAGVTGLGWSVSKQSRVVRWVDSVVSVVFRFEWGRRNKQAVGGHLRM